MDFEKATRQSIFNSPSRQRVILENWVKAAVANNPSKVLYIGTDSQNHARTCFTNVIVAYEQGKGGIFIFRKYTRPKILELFRRLSMETWDSIYLAMLVSEILDEIKAKNKIIVNLDINTRIKFDKDHSCKSGKHMNELISYVVSQGFECQVKPDAFAASAIADRFTKNV